MALHPLSKLITTPEFDLYSVPPTKVSVDEDIQSEHTPYTNFANNTNSITFTFTTPRDEYILLRKSELYVRMRIDLSHVSSDTGGKLTLADWKRICPINYMLNTMWKSIKLEIGNTQVSTTTFNYAYESYLDALINVPKDVKQTHLRTALWSKDNYGHMEDISEIRSSEIRPINEEWDNGAEFELIGYLHLDLCSQIKAIPGGLTINLTLFPHDPKFYLMYDPAVLVPKVTFTDIKFQLHRSKVNSDLLKGLLAPLQHHTFKYPITRKICRQFVIQRDLIEYHENNVIKNSRLPRKCFIAFVSNEALNGAPNLNPFNFKNYNIQNIRVNLNSKEYPPHGFDCNFERGLIKQAYRGFYEASGQIERPNCSITQTEWSNGMTIFGFNFIPDLSDGVGRNGYVTPIKDGDMSLHIKFASPLEETATAVIFMEFDNLIEIPLSGIPFKDFH